MKVIYTAGKYSANSEWEMWQNIQHASMVARTLWMNGYAVICPHRNTMFFGSGRADDHKIWLDGDLEILSRVDVIYMLKGWQESTGATMEHARAEELGLEILYEEE